MSKEEWGIYRDWRKEKQKKRQKNKEYSTKILIENGIKFKSFNNGIHLRIGNVNFYPSTGLFQGPDFAGRGIKNLLKKLKRKNREER
jgi:hypothetical protein